MIDVKIDYDTIITFVNKTLSSDDKHAYPEYDNLKEIVNRFINLYKIGIIKYPDEDDFFTCIEDKKSDIKNVESEFTEYQVNIINTVLNSNTCKEKKKNPYRKQVLDIFKSHYNDIWNNLTKTQRRLCIDLVMKEKDEY